MQQMRNRDGAATKAEIIPACTKYSLGGHMNIKKISLATVLGGLTLFIWGALSHYVLPFYNNALHKFTDQDAVRQAIIANTPRSGTYLLPNYPDYPENATDAEKKALDEEMNQQMQAGPFVFAHIRVESFHGFASHLALELLTNILAVVFVTLIIINLPATSIGGRVLLSTAIALVMVLDRSASTWNWYSAGADFFFAEFFDAVVGWGLVGLVIGISLRTREEPGR